MGTISIQDSKIIQEQYNELKKEISTLKKYFSFTVILFIIFFTVFIAILKYSDFINTSIRNITTNTTLLSLIAVLVGMVAYHIKKLEIETKESIQQLRIETKESIQQLDARIDKLDARIDKLDSKIDRVIDILIQQKR